MALHNERAAQRVTSDVVAIALEALTAPETCPGPNCNIAFELSGECMYYVKVYTLSPNAGGCAAIPCSNCHCNFCFWCRSVIVKVAGSKHKDDSTEAHAHVFECQKRPALAQLLYESVLFPVGTNGDHSAFIDSFLKIQKLEILALQLQKGWSSENIKRLVLNVDFQELLVNLRKTQTEYRNLFPHKPELLRFPFHKVGSWCL